jgi:hypothetical protein
MANAGQTGDFSEEADFFSSTAPPAQPASSSLSALGKTPAILRLNHCLIPSFVVVLSHQLKSHLSGSNKGYDGF